MPQVRFNHVFVGLMVLSFLCAFVIPTEYSDRVRNVQGLFAPVARPAGAIGGWIRGRTSPEKVEDKRPDFDIRRENDELKVAIANLEAQLEFVRKSDASLNVGALRPLCARVPVVGSDSGTRESLSLGVVSGLTLRDHMAVLYTGGLVGQVDRAGSGGAQVRLITDPSSKVTAYFGRWVQRDSTTQPEFQRTATEVALVEGIGKGTMMVRNLNIKDVKSLNLREGDWAVLNDNDWPTLLAGQRLGKIVSIRARTDAPLKAEIRLQPQQNLSALREVMVLTKE
jgi:hypothetical protein